MLPYNQMNPPRMVVSKRGSFDAAHANSAIGGKCARVHGHRYEYEVFARGRVNPETSVVIDFREMSKTMKAMEHDHLDHYFLNDIFSFTTSAENVCYWIYTYMKMHHPEVYRVTLRETESAGVEFNEDHQGGAFQ